MESELGAALKLCFTEPSLLLCDDLEGCNAGRGGKLKKEGVHIYTYISVFLLSRFLSFLRIHFVPLIPPVSTLPLLVP